MRLIYALFTAKVNLSNKKTDNQLNINPPLSSANLAKKLLFKFNHIQSSITACMPITPVWLIRFLNA